MPTFRSITTSLRSQLGFLIIPEFAPPPGSNDALGTAQPSQSQDDSVVTVYVPQYACSHFYIMYSVSGPHPKGAYYFFKLFVNGKSVTSWSIGEKDYFNGKMEFALFESGTHDQTGIPLTQRRVLCFGAERALDDKLGPLDDCVEIRVYRCAFRQRIQKGLETYGCSEIGKAEAEGRWAADDIRMVNAGPLREKHPERFYKHQLLDPLDTPFATFRYLYRSWDYLARIGVIETSPTTSQASLTSSPTTSNKSSDEVSSFADYSEILPMNGEVKTNAIEQFKDSKDTTSNLQPKTSANIDHEVQSGLAFGESNDIATEEDVFAKLKRLAAANRPRTQTSPSKEPLVEDEHGKLVPMSQSPVRDSVHEGDILGKLAKLLPMTESPSSSFTGSPVSQQSKQTSVKTSDADENVFDKLAKIAANSPPRATKLLLTKNADGILMQDHSSPPPGLIDFESRLPLKVDKPAPISKHSPLIIDTTKTSTHKITPLNHTPITPCFLQDLQHHNKTSSKLPKPSPSKLKLAESNKNDTIALDGIEYPNKSRRPLSPFGAGGLLRRKIPKSSPPTVTTFGPNIDQDLAAKTAARLARNPPFVSKKRDRTPEEISPSWNSGNRVDNGGSGGGHNHHGATMTMLKGFVGRATARKERRETPTPEAVWLCGEN